MFFKFWQKNGYGAIGSRSKWNTAVQFWLSYDYRMWSC